MPGFNGYELELALAELSQLGGEAKEYKQVALYANYITAEACTPEDLFAMVKRVTVLEAPSGHLVDKVLRVVVNLLPEYRMYFLTKLSHHQPFMQEIQFGEQTLPQFYAYFNRDWLLTVFSKNNSFSKADALVNAHNPNKQPAFDPGIQPLLPALNSKYGHFFTAGSEGSVLAAESVRLLKDYASPESVPGFLKGIALFVSCHRRRHHVTAVGMALTAGQSFSCVEDVVTAVLAEIGRSRNGGVVALDLLTAKKFDSSLYRRLAYIIHKDGLSKPLDVYISEARAAAQLQIGSVPEPAGYSQ